MTVIWWKKEEGDEGTKQNERKGSVTGVKKKSKQTKIKLKITSEKKGSKNWSVIYFFCFAKDKNKKKNN